MSYELYEDPNQGGPYETEGAFLVCNCGQTIPCRVEQLNAIAVRGLCCGRRDRKRGAGLPGPIPGWTGHAIYRTQGGRVRIRNGLKSKEELMARCVELQTKYGEES